MKVLGLSPGTFVFTAVAVWTLGPQHVDREVESPPPLGTCKYEQQPVTAIRGTPIAKPMPVH
jgi:hypothetical protein